MGLRAKNDLPPSTDATSEDEAQPAEEPDSQGQGSEL
jgi:hypothetical protein